MKASLLLPSISIALVLATPAYTLAYTLPAATSQQDTQANQNTQKSQSQIRESNVLSIHKLKQDLEQAGFTDIKVLEDSFVIQARDKMGNPTIMSLSPSGVLAISEISQQRQNNATDSAGDKQGGRTARMEHSSNEAGQSSGPAEGTNIKPSQGGGSAGEPGTPGFPGNKNGPAATPPNQSER